MITYGALFKEFREAKGYSIREVSEDIVSYQFLNNFEKGNSNISLSNFIKLLEKINLTYEEFFNVYDQTLARILHDAIEEIRVVGSSWNILTAQQLIQKYKKLYDETDWIVYHHIALAIEMITIMSRGDQQEVSAEYFQNMKREVKDYLFKIETWTYYERKLFIILIFLFSKDEIVEVMNRSLRNMKLNSNKLRMIDSKSIEEMLGNAILELLRKDAVKEAENLLTLLKANIKRDNSIANIADNINTQYVEGLVKCRFNDESGLDDVCNVLNILVLMNGYEPIANAMYNTYLMHHKSSLLNKKIIPGNPLFTIEPVAENV